MKKMFLEKFFPASRTTSIKKEICGIKQHSGETLYEFNKLCATCPYHQVSEQLLIQYFYEALMLIDRSMIDVSSGGAFMDNIPTATRNLISNMASNTRQFGIRGVLHPKLGNKITKLTFLVRQLAIRQHVHRLNCVGPKLTFISSKKQVYFNKGAHRSRHP
ncbi:hypothetical protein CR513_11306, partial [Mucuna pruriens]